MDKLQPHAKTATQGQTVKPTNCYYIGVYQSNDLLSRKSCDVYLVFGEPNGTKMHTNNASDDFNWKHALLPCPHCNFIHSFKRISFGESIALPGGDMLKADSQ
jgi:hypothetical protein